METKFRSISEEELKKLVKDVELLKEILLSSRYREDPEGELSDWAIKELEKSRKTPLSEFISLEEAKNKLLK